MDLGQSKSWVGKTSHFMIHNLSLLDHLALLIVLKEIVSHLSDEPMFHSWVYVHFEGHDSVSFFLESTTGERRALGDERYHSVNCLWNQVRAQGLRMES